MARKAFNTTIEEDLLKELKMLAVSKDTKINDLIEAGIRMVLNQEKEKEDTVNER